MIHLGRVSEERLRRLRDEQGKLEVTYAEVGGTRKTDLPPGYNHDRHPLVVGMGDDAWERAKEAIRTWRAHAAAGVTVYPAEAPLVEGETVALALPVGPLVAALASCRIVYVINSVDEFGFGYGTLPAHPETGEESFVVRRDGDAVIFTVTVFSRPVHPLVRATAPIGRRMQNAVTRKYLEGVRAHVAGAEG
ncbi:MAG: hypothetical protein QOG03_2030 [Actinomycetota bacterium]|jgi:uncharacterized protein (UPF0548 family)|nr:hypothetical protein [Actinomycetota bacterium]